MAKEDVVDFLAKINSEGTSYYFSEYASPDNVKAKALSVGVSEDTADELKKAAEQFCSSLQSLNRIVEQIHDEHGIEEWETEY